MAKPKIDIKAETERLPVGSRVRPTRASGCAGMGAGIVKGHAEDMLRKDLDVFVFYKDDFEGHTTRFKSYELVRA